MDDHHSDDRRSGAPTSSDTLSSLACAVPVIDQAVTFGAVRREIEAARPGFVVQAGAEIVAVIGRERLASLISRVGVDLFGYRPLADLVRCLGPAEPLVIRSDVDVSEAVRAALQRPDQSRFDPLVMAGSVPRLIDFGRLLVRHGEIAEAMAEEARHQRAVADEASRARSAFVATMSHELRTPLNSILGFVELIEAGALSEREHRRAVEVIRRNGQHLLGLVNDVLDLTRLESGAIEIESAPVDPTELVLDVVESLMPRAVEHRTELRFHVQTGGSMVTLGDALRIRQAILNVVGNAVKFSPGACVDVSIGVDLSGPGGRAPRWWCHCLDTGTGIDPEKLERVFQPFVQAESATTRRFGGSGLGLAIVRRTMDELGGTVTIASEVGRGTDVRLQFPFEAATDRTAAEDAPAKLGDAMRPIESIAPASDVGPPPPASGGDDGSAADARGDGGAAAGPRVLVIEDGPDNVRLFRLVLTKAGYDVSVARDGRRGVAAAETARDEGRAFACILMDLHMPELDGLEATRRLRADGHDQPILALTASTADEDRAAFAAAGSSGFVPKPVSPADLRAHVAAAIAASSGHVAADRPDAGPGRRGRAA